MYIDIVGSPRTMTSDTHATTNHHGACHHRRTPHVDAPSPTTSKKIATTPRPSAIGGTA